MTKVQEKHHYYTDQERYEYCRKCKLSRKTISEFAQENGLCRSILRDWMNAYNNINGKFINNERENIKEKDRKESKAYEILEEIKKLFHLEATYKKKKLIPNEIVKRRKEDVPLIKEKIKKLVFETNPLKGSALEGAINYTNECWDDLFTFVNNGYVEISNNIAEQAVKPFVIQRKVFQTSGSYAGARYTTKLFSIVQTCKINNINVERYFDHVLKNINNEQI